MEARQAARSVSSPPAVEVLPITVSPASFHASQAITQMKVKTHVGRVLAKTGSRDRAQAVILAYETGLVRPGQAGG